jgi:hypothetical protein
VRYGIVNVQVGVRGSSRTVSWIAELHKIPKLFRQTDEQYRHSPPKIKI